MGRFGCNAKKYTTSELDNPSWLAANYPLINPHAHPSYSQSMVKFDPDIGDFTSKRLTMMKFWRFQDQFLAKPSSGTVSPLRFGGMASKEASCSILSYIVYRRCEADTNMVVKRRMTMQQACDAATASPSTENAGLPFLVHLSSCRRLSSVATIPDPVEDPESFYIVAKTMVHK